MCHYSRGGRRYYTICVLGGGERGSSGSSRGAPNVVTTNASIDQFAKELEDIVEGNTNPLSPFYKLSRKKIYEQFF